MAVSGGIANARGTGRLSSQTFRDEPVAVTIVTVEPPRVRREAGSVSDHLPTARGGRQVFLGGPRLAVCRRRDRSPSWRYNSFPSQRYLRRHDGQVPPGLAMGRGSRSVLGARAAISGKRSRICHRTVYWPREEEAPIPASAEALATMRPHEDLEFLIPHGPHLRLPYRRGTKMAAAGMRALARSSARALRIEWRRDAAFA